MINHNRVVNTGAQSTTPLVGTYADPSSLSATPGKLPPPPTDDKNWLGFHSYVEIDLPERDPAVRPRPQPTPRARSHTIAGRKIQNSMCCYTHTQTLCTQNVGVSMMSSSL